MSERRRALGRGLGALIPSGAGESQNQRPVDVFFRDQQQEPGPEQDSRQATTAAETAASPETPPTEKSAAKTATKTKGSTGRKDAASPTRKSTAAAPKAAAVRNLPDTASADGGVEDAEAPLSASEALLKELESDSPGEAASGGAKAAESVKTPKKTTQQAKRKSASTGGARAQKAKESEGSKPGASDRDQPGSDQPSSEEPNVNSADSASGDHGSGDHSSADPDGLQPVPGATFAEIPIGSLSPNASQPRQVFDDDELNELAGSIREVGVLQPVVVRPSGTDVDGQATYELIMGERRWRAARIAAQTAIPAIIRETAHEDMLRDALLENLHRVQLNPLEEAAAYQQLLEDFGCTHDELAVRISRSRPQISNTLRLMKLPPLVQRRVAAGILSAGHARALLGLSDGAAMERLAQRIVAEGLSVRATEEIIALGDEPMQPEMRRRRRDDGHSIALNELAGRLSDGLDTKVKVKLGQRKGQVSIEFASMGDLNRILGVLVPSDPGVSDGAEEDPAEDVTGPAEAGD